MLSQQLAPVLDIYPWPNGLGFENSVYWWDYVHRQNESEKLDLLLTAALLSEEISRLLLNHDDELLRSFCFSEATIRLMREIDAASLSTFTARLLACRTQGEWVPDAF